MILCSGAFDGLHAGHVRYLQNAARLDRGQELRVAIAPDTYIRHHKRREPMWPQSDRAHTVFALSMVDHVVLQREDSVAQTILETKPTIFAKGKDWQDKLPDDVLKACHDVGASVVFLHSPGIHTSEARR